MGTGRAVDACKSALAEQQWPPRWVGYLPPALILTALVLDGVLPPRYIFGSLLSAGIILTALVYPVWAVVLTGVASTVLLLFVHSLDAPVGQAAIGIILALVMITAVSALLTSARDRALRRLSRVQAVAEAAQLALLRPLPSHMGPVRLAGFYQAADTEALIGGDLYSVRQTRYGVRLIVGDVKGKGIGATETVATVISAFREAAMVSPTLEDVADRIEAAMALDRVDAATGASRVSGGPRDAESEEELFATAVLLEFPPGTTAVRVLDRGHPPLLRIGRQGTSLMEAEYGVPLGLGDLLPNPASAYFTTEPGELIAAYSDGVAEARNANGDFYPLEQRLNEHFRDGPPPDPAAPSGSASRAAPTHNPRAIDPAEVATFIQHDVAAWAPRLSDDVVVVVLQPGMDVHSVEHAPSGSGLTAPPGGA